MGRVQQNLRKLCTAEAITWQPAFVAECRVPSNTALEEASLLLTILKKLPFLQLCAVIGADGGVEGAVEPVAGVVACREDGGVEEGLRVLHVGSGGEEDRSVVVS